MGQILQAGLACPFVDLSPFSLTEKAYVVLQKAIVLKNSFMYINMPQDCSPNLACFYPKVFLLLVKLTQDWILFH